MRQLLNNHPRSQFPECADNPFFEIAVRTPWAQEALGPVRTGRASAPRA
jgi:hypothetical protein